MKEKHPIEFNYRKIIKPSPVKDDANAINW